MVADRHGGTVLVVSEVGELRWHRAAQVPEPIVSGSNGETSWK
jgi:hypothetical protein